MTNIFLCHQKPINNYTWHPITGELICGRFSSDIFPLEAEMQMLGWKKSSKICCKDWEGEEVPSAEIPSEESGYVFLGNQRETQEYMQKSQHRCKSLRGSVRVFTEIKNTMEPSFVNAGRANEMGKNNLKNQISKYSSCPLEGNILFSSKWSNWTGCLDKWPSSSERSLLADDSVAHTEVDNWKDLSLMEKLWGYTEIVPWGQLLLFRGGDEGTIQDLRGSKHLWP